MATKTLTVRFPDDLHDRIKASADTDLRSLNSQVIWLIETGLAQRGKAAR